MWFGHMAQTNLGPEGFTLVTNEPFLVVDVQHWEQNLGP